MRSRLAALQAAACGAAFVATFATSASPARAASFGVLPADGQTVKFRLTGDRQTLNGDLNLNTLLTLQRTGILVAVNSDPTPGTPDRGSARILDDGSLLIAIGEIAVMLNAVSLASVVAQSAPPTLSLITTWSVPAPVVVAGARVQVPLNVLVTDPAAAHTALHGQGRVSATLQGADGPVPGTVSLDFTINFKNGAFTSSVGTVFSDASPESGVHSITNWNLVPAP
jgi:hypothetical protein